MNATRLTHTLGVACYHVGDCVDALADAITGSACMVCGPLWRASMRLWSWGAWLAPTLTPVRTQREVANWEDLECPF